MSIRTNLVLEGFEELQDRINDVMLNTERSLEATSNFIAQSTAQRAKNLIQRSSPAGDIHFRENPDRYVRASAPGQPPAIDLGNLIRSISFKKYQTGAAYAYAGAYYAEDLEFGTDKIAPRPFMLPAFIAAVDRAEQLLKQEFESRT